jgi:RNA polymerase sigma factor (sigma-70 family)
MLTDRQREVLVAHYYLGLRHEEIADALGIRPGTVAATISQAIRRMRKGSAYA